MSTTAQIILAVGIIFFIISVLLMIFAKQEGVKLRSVLWVTPFFYKELGKRIKPKFIKPIMVTSYIGISSIWIAILFR